MLANSVGLLLVSSNYILQIFFPNHSKVAIRLNIAMYLRVWSETVILSLKDKFFSIRFCSSPYCVWEGVGKICVCRVIHILAEQ